MALHATIWLLVATFLASATAVAEEGRIHYVTYGLAFLAFLLLSLTFSCGPLARRTKRRPWGYFLAHQRALGVYSFLVIAGHVFCLWQFKYRWSFSAATGSAFQWIAFALLHGACLVLFAMFLTSNDMAVRALGPWWKRLHRLGLVAYAIISLGVLAATLVRPFLRPLFPVILLVTLGVLVARLSGRDSRAT